MAFTILEKSKMTCTFVEIAVVKRFLAVIILQGIVKAIPVIIVVSRVG
jgi:hypothetical protein